MSEYRLEVSHWSRSRDGDDWVDSEYWVMFQSLSEAMERVGRISDPLNRTLIEVRLYNMADSKDLVYKKDFISGKVEDYTTIPDFDYHNREYK
jgi:hypothetical protein